MPRTVGAWRDICQKGGAEPFIISKYLVRPWSIYLTMGAARLRVSPEVVTVWSGLFAVVGSLLLVRLTPQTAAASALAVLVFFVLDHVDGELARLRKFLDDRGSKAARGRALSGNYLDRLMHYFQGPSTVACLGIGLSGHYGSPLFAAAGVLGALGSSGFPRFVAAYDVLRAVAAGQVEPGDVCVEAIADFNVRFVGVGGSLAERPSLGWGRHRLLHGGAYWGRQLVGFPGNIFIFVACIVLDIVTAQGVHWYALSGFLITYSVILTANLVSATRHYWKVLAG